ncbi:MAG: hypothetical protein UY18_C0037G0001, partial [Microgenomates group bacterium GW2011_GWF2_47_9]
MAKHILPSPFIPVVLTVGNNGDVTACTLQAQDTTILRKDLVPFFRVQLGLENKKIPINPGMSHTLLASALLDENGNIAGVTIGDITLSLAEFRERLQLNLIRLSQDTPPPLVFQDYVLPLPAQEDLSYFPGYPAPPNKGLARTRSIVEVPPLPTSPIE